MLVVVVVVVVVVLLLLAAAAAAAAAWWGGGIGGLGVARWRGGAVARWRVVGGGLVGWWVVETGGDGSGARAVAYHGVPCALRCKQ